MKFTWVISLIVGIATLAGGVKLEGPGGAVLLLLGMLIAFATIPLFVLGEYEPKAQTTDI